MSVTLSPPMFLQFFDPNNSGAPLSGGKLFTYIAGTSTKQATWTDSTQTVQNSNPIILDSNGIANVWLDPSLLAYKFVLAPANDTDPPASPLRTVDNIQGYVTLATLTQVFIGSVLYPRTSAEIAAGVTPANFVYPPGSVDRYGTNTTPGTTDMSAALTAANAQWVSGGAPVQFVSGIYSIVSALTIAAPVTFTGNATLKPTTIITLNGPVATPAGTIKIFNLPATGVVAYVGVPTGGAAYVNGTYTNVPLTGGTGSGARATITVSGGAVINPVTITTVGTGYTTGDSLSASNANLGGAGAGFAVTVLSVAQVLGSLGNVDLYTRWYGDVADGNSSAGTGTDNQPFFSRALGTANLRATSFTTAPNRVITLSGVYRCNSGTFVGDNIVWMGGGKFVTQIFCPTAFADQAGLIRIGGISSFPTRFSGFNVSAQVGGAGGCGIVSTKNAAFISDVWVSGFISHVGIILSSTDNFLSDFAAELNLFGVQVTASDVNIEFGTTYQCSAAGMIINNTGGVGNTDAGRVTVSNVRDTGSAQNAFLVTSGQHVTLSNCHALGQINANYNVGAFQFGSVTDVTMDGCSGSMVAGASTAPGILIGASCVDVIVSAARMAGFYDGLQGSSAADIVVSGGIYAGNSRNGVLLSACTNALVTGVLSRNNAAAGIDLENTNAASYMSAVGNMCISNSTFGIIANCAATSFINVQANMNRANSSGPTSFLGTTANINQGAAPTNY